MSGLKKVFENALWRHVFTLLMAALAAGAIWGTTKADIGQLKTDQSQTDQTVREIRSAVTQAVIDSAVTRQELVEIKRRLNGLDTKLDTLIWRSSPANPSSPYPQPVPPGR